MNALYQPMMIKESQLLLFCNQLEDTEVFKLIENEQLIKNKNERPILLSCFDDISKYKEHIQKGLVHEIYVNTNYAEDFSNHIPEICKTKVLEHANKFQNIFLFRTWSI